VHEIAAPFKSNGAARLALVRVFRKVQTTAGTSRTRGIRLTAGRSSTGTFDHSTETNHDHRTLPTCLLEPLPVEARKCAAGLRAATRGGQDSPECGRGSMPAKGGGAESKYSILDS
jgi:hypothetical protein